VQSFFDGKIIMIRPLSLVPADNLRRFAKFKGFPVQPPCCPSAGNTKRARVGEVLQSFFRENKKIRGNLWHALTSTDLPHMPTSPSITRKRRKRPKK
jgi:tRNA 2-thiocytidine biosynthesis protein TtcA